MEIIIVLIIIIAAVIFFLWRKQKGTSRTEALKKEYQRYQKLSPDKADEVIDRHMKRLKEKYPGRSEEWYLEKMIYDLKRDRD